MSIFRETGPLLNKSWLLFRKNKILRIIRILVIPSLFLVATTLITSGIFKSGKEDLRRDPSYEPLHFSSIDSLRDCAAESGITCSIGIVPSFSNVEGGYPVPNQQALFEAWKPFLEIEFDSIPLVYFENVSILESTYALNNSIFGGIVFDSSKYPNNVRYDIRLPFSKLAAPAPYERPSMAMPEAADLIGGSKNYIESGFNEMQLAVDRSLANFLVARASDFPSHRDFLAKMDLLKDFSESNSRRMAMANSTLSLNVSVSRGPHSEFSVASKLSSIPMTIHLAFVTICIFFFQDIAGEKQSGMKEYLHALGLSPRAYWIVNALLMIAAVAPLCAAQIGLTIWARLWGPNTLYGVLYLLSFALCTVAYTMMNCTISLTQRAANLWNVLFFIPPIILGSLSLSAPFGIRVALCLLAPFNLLFAVLSACKQTILSITGPTQRMPPSLISIPDMPPSVSIFFFAFDLLLYVSISFIVSWLRNRRIPPLSAEKEKKQRSGRGPRESLVRPFDASVGEDNMDESARLLIHSGRETINSAADILSEAEDAIEIGESTRFRASRNYDHFEPRDAQDPTHIRIYTKNLSLQTNPKRDPELAPLDLRIDDGIYVLVGGHSCGKSALLSIISGFDIPSTGSVEIEGFNLYEYRDHARANISVCPSTNHFVEQMTAREHLEFILSLRQGEMDEYEIMVKVNDMLSEMELDLVADEPIEKYTAGMLRSLMVASALIAPSNIVILDEPSTGMNQQQKQAMWRSILRRRSSNATTFILATQCLNEAETIADRIGIMFNGQLLREGSVEFLTRKLGFQLHLKGPHSTEALQSNAKSDPLIQVPVTMKDSLPQQIKNLEEKHGVGSISVVSPSLRAVLGELEVSLDDSTDEDSVHDPIFDQNSPLDKLDASTFKKSPLYRETPPKRANAFQQMIQYMKRRIPVGLRNIGPTIIFLILPIALAAAGLGISRIPGHSLHNMPQILHGLRPHSTEAVPLGFGTDLPLQIPVVSDSQWTSNTISPWILDNQFTFPTFRESQDMYNFLWKAEDPNALDQGGFELMVDFPSQISYNIAFNMSEVYSSTNLLNLINNMAIRLFLLENVGMLLPANVSSPFIQIRSSPLIPRENIGLKQDSDSERVNLIVSTISSTESGFPTQISISLAILGVFIGTQLLIERDRGLVAQFRRSGLRLVSYWLGTMLWAAARMIVVVSLILSVTAIFKVSFVEHAPLGLYFVSLLLASWTLLPLVAIMIRRYTVETVEGVAGTLVALVIVPRLLEGVLAPIFTGSKVRFIGVLLSNIHYLSPLALFPAFVQQLALAYANEGFTMPPMDRLLSFQYCGTVLLVQLAHLLVWSLIFWFLEFRSRTVVQHTDDAIELGEWELENGAADDPDRGFGAHIPDFVPSGGLQRLKPSNSIYHSPQVSRNGNGKSHQNMDSSHPDQDISQRNIGEKDVILDEESDIEAESEARTTDYRAAAIKTEALVKRWDGMPRRAIPPLTLSIPIGHSYAIVGPKNSGKTTILSLLLGDEASTSGKVEFYGNSAVGMHRNRLYNIARFGACLQREALFAKMTVQEHIELSLSLRNDLWDIDVTSATRFILQKSRLVRFANTYTEDLEKGPKQKLNLALAALTFTETLILDEPTRGCDAASRRTIWELLRYIHTDQNKTLLITTPSLEEAMATCGSVGILVNGQIVAAASPSALHRACNGFELKVWILDDFEEEAEPIDPLIKLKVMMSSENFASAKLVRSQVSRNLSLCVTYDLPGSITLSSAVDQLNREVQNGLLIDYQITSLSPELAYQRAIQSQEDDYSRYLQSQGISYLTWMKVGKYACKLCK